MTALILSVVLPQLVGEGQPSHFTLSSRDKSVSGQRGSSDRPEDRASTVSRAHAVDGGMAGEIDAVAGAAAVLLCPVRGFHVAVIGNAGRATGK